MYLKASKVVDQTLRSKKNLFRKRLSKIWVNNIFKSRFTDETHWRERSAFQRRQTVGTRTSNVVSVRETVATRGQIQRRIAYPNSPVAPVRADRIRSRQRNRRIHGRGEFNNKLQLLLKYLLFGVIGHCTIVLGGHFSVGFFFFFWKKCEMWCLIVTILCLTFLRVNFLRKLLFVFSIKNAFHVNVYFSCFFVP